MRLIAVLVLFVSGFLVGQEALPPGDRELVGKAVRTWLGAAVDARPGVEIGEALDVLVASRAEAVRDAAWAAYRGSSEHGGLKKDFEERKVRNGKYVSPYTLKTVGKRPEGGWPLFIAMHGGGGVPKRVNDSQWRIMQRYYRDQPSVGGYLYLALRAPTDEWNGFYTGYMYPLVAKLVRQFLLFGDVAPDRVHIMGYSHGGYGAFAIGPKMPHRFASIHSSAAAPTGGQTAARNLRNTVFTFMIGEKDTAYGRIDRCRAFDAGIRDLRGNRKDIYPVKMEYIAGNGHGGLPDRDKIKDMWRHVRSPVPKSLTWELTGGVIHDHFWLHVPDPAGGQAVEATVMPGNRIRLETREVGAVELLLDGRLVTPGEPITVVHGGESTTHAVKPRFRTLLETMHARGDPQLAATVRIRVNTQ